MEELFFLSIEGEEEWLSFFQGPVGAGAVIAIAPQLPIEDQPLEDDSESFSYYSGPLSADAVAVINSIQNWIDDNLTNDDSDYDFSLAPLSADLVAASDMPLGWLDDDTPIDDADYDLSVSPLSDDLVVIFDQMQNIIDDDFVIDDVEYDFSSSPLSDDFVAVIDQLQNSFDDDVISDDGDYDFVASPISDDFVIQQDTPFQWVDDLDENFIGDEYLFYLGIVGNDASSIPTVIIDDFSGHDGKPRKQQHEYAHDAYLKRKREIEAALAKAVKTFEPDVLDDAELLQVLDDAPKRTLQSVSNMVTEYRKLIARLDQLKLDEDVAIAMMLFQ